MLFAILSIPIIMLLIIFIQISMNLALSEKRSNHDATKTNDERAKDEPQDSESRSDTVFPAVQSKQEVQEEKQSERIYNGEYKTVTVSIDEIPYDCRHTLCFDCEYCYCPKLGIKECSRRTQKIVWNPVSKRGYCINREENED